MMIPAPAPPRPRPVTPAVKRARIAGAGRMRLLRARRAAEGIPDPATLDRAIVDALRDVIAARTEGDVTRPLSTARIVKTTACHLLARQHRARSSGQEGVKYDRKAIADAIYQRILAPRPAR